MPNIVSPLDQCVLGCAVVSFLTFWLAQLIFFRSVPPGGIFKALMSFALTGLCVAAGLSSGVLLKLSAFSAISMGERVGCFFLTLLIYFFLVFLYILCVLGPYESSIRLRLVRELYRAFPQSLTPAQLFDRYNARWILERRIQRLLTSGDIVCRDRRYYLVKKYNAFFLADKVAQMLARLTSRSGDKK